MGKYLPLFLAVLLAAGCVSRQLADDNLTGVALLSQEVDNPPLEEQALDDANAIVEATAPINQITHLGLPSELVKRNYYNVQNLSKGVEDKPAAKMAIKASTELYGKSTAVSNFKEAAGKTPWLSDVLAALTAVGSAIGVLYGATRGQKHVREWWKTPPKSA